MRRQKTAELPKLAKDRATLQADLRGEKWRNSQLGDDLLAFDKIISEVGMICKRPNKYGKLDDEAKSDFEGEDLESNETVTKSKNEVQDGKKIEDIKIITRVFEQAVLVHQKKRECKNEKKTLENISPYSAAQLEDYSEKEKASAQHIRDWIEEISNPCSEMASKLQAAYSFCLPAAAVAAVDQSSGQKQGFLMRENFKSKDGRKCIREVSYAGGLRHGFYRGMFEDNQLKMFGRFANGAKVGSQWTWCEGDG